MKGKMEPLRTLRDLDRERKEVYNTEPLSRSRRKGDPAMRRRLLPVLFAALMLPCGLAPAHAQPRLSFGVVSDIQWSNKETSGAMDYRGSLSRLQLCVDALNLEKVAFVVQLGDFIDGWEGDAVRSGADVDTVLKVFNRLKSTKIHVAGNHCYRATPQVLLKKWKLKKLYYDFTVPSGKGWRFLVLDGNDAGYGVMGQAQLAWLQKTLALASKKKERVIVFCHFPLLREASPNHRLNNPEAVLPILERAGCVAAYIAGHDHAGGYTEQKGIHHITLTGLVEHPGKVSYAMMQVYDDRLKELGFGDEPVRTCILAAPTTGK